MMLLSTLIEIRVVNTNIKGFENERIWNFWNRRIILHVEIYEEKLNEHLLVSY